MHFLKRSPSAGTAARIAFGTLALWLSASLPVASQVLPPAASAREAAVTRALPKVVPFEFKGDLSKVPAMPAGRSRSLVYRPKMPEPPKKQPGARAAAPSAPSAPEVPAVPQGPMPSPTQNFAGMSMTDACTGGSCGGGWPADVNGDVGPNHYIQSVNSSYAIYNKTGTRLAAFTEDSLWSSAGASVCNGSSAGDPVVLYDWLSDRWILTHFAFNSDISGNPVSPFYQCIAASKTSDPVSGGWWLYAVRMDPGGVGQPPVGALNDYGKFGLWHDCLYMAANEFQMPGGAYSGVAFASFSRADLYSGAALTSSIGYLADTNLFTLIPSNNLGRGSAAVQPGTPNYFVSETWTTAYAFEVRKFTAGPNCGAGGSLSGPTFVSQASYDYNAGANVPQPNTATGLDPLYDRLLQKVQYRKMGTTESLWVVHSVRPAVGTTLRPQWAQIDVTAGTVATTPVQQQIYAPDSTLNRWMGSLAVDHQGNMALGYSTSNGAAPNFPSIAYSGRLAGDPLNTLPQTETQMIAGGGSQIFLCGGVPCDRWGDYSSMSVDPSDDCTFWYTNQYYSSQANGNIGNWQTRIGSFKFAQCVPVAPPVFRAYLSGHGADTNPCTLLLPCRLLPRAIDAVANDGEVWMLDSANYNVTPVMVNKSVAILAVPGAIGSVVAFGATAGAIVINASAVTVSLRNVVVVPFPGPGSADGIVMTGPSTLAVENSLIANLNGNGVNVTGVGKLKISDSIIRSNTGFAVLLGNGAAGEISGTQMLANGGGGVSAQSTTATSTTASVSDSFISGKVVGDAGVHASTTVASAIARIVVTRSAIEGVDRAVKSVTNGSGSASIALSDSMVVNNAYAWEQTGIGSVIRSLGNNHITDNGTWTGVLTSTPPQ